MKDKNTKSEDFMSVGELAKKMGTTVRTLQYYDKEGLLSPTAQSEGGRRLYTYKDMIKLHQIQSLKSLDFSLDDIKNRLISLDTPDAVATVLSEQALAIEKKISELSTALTSIESLKSEVLQMQSVDFKKYADIIINLQMHNEYYWLIKHFDNDMLDHIRKRFDKESGADFMERFNLINDKALILQQNNVLPESPEAQTIAKAFWDLVMEFTKGDLSMLPKLMDFEKNFTDENNEWVNKQKVINEYLGPALDIYLKNLGIDALEES